MKIKTLIIILFLLIPSTGAQEKSAPRKNRGRYLKMLPQIISDAWRSTVFDVYYISEKAVFDAIQKKDDSIYTAISKKLSLNIRNKDNFSMIEKASQNGLEKTVAALIQAGADVNTVCPDDGMPDASKYGRKEFSPLMFAAYSGHTALCETLIKNNADVHYETSYGYTALYCAAVNGYSDTVKYLISAGSSVKKIHADSNTEYSRLVTVCCLKSRFDSNLAEKIRGCIEIIALAGADTDYPNNYGVHPAITAMLNTQNIAIISTVIKYSNKLFVPDKKGTIPFLAAVNTANPEIVKLFLNEPVPDELLKKARSITFTPEIIELLKKN